MPSPSKNNRILLCALNYHPELVGIGKYTTEMAEWLSKQGYEVQVIAAPPYYPEWKIRAGYGRLRYRSEIIRGVRVLRCPLWVPAKPRGLTRILHMISFALSTFPALLWSALRFRPSVICLFAPPFACSPGALAASWISGASSWLHIQDLEIDAALALGFVRGKLAAKILRAAERFLLNRFDRVTTIAPAMREAIQAKKIRTEVELLPNWVASPSPVALLNVDRARLGLPASPKIALYSGTLNAKQGLEVMIDAARVLEREQPASEIRIVIAGDGPLKAELQARARGLSNVLWLPFQPEDRFRELLGCVDLHLIATQSKVRDLVLPSKLGPMMASGRCVLGAVDPDCQIARILEGRGRICAPEDPAALARAITELIAVPAEREKLGAHGQAYALETWGIDRCLRAFTDGVERLAG